MSTQRFSIVVDFLMIRAPMLILEQLLLSPACCFCCSSAQIAEGRISAVYDAASATLAFVNPPSLSTSSSSVSSGSATASAALSVAARAADESQRKEALSENVSSVHKLVAALRASDDATHLSPVYMKRLFAEKQAAAGGGGGGGPMFGGFGGGHGGGGGGFHLGGLGMEAFGGLLPGGSFAGGLGAFGDMGE